MDTEELWGRLEEAVRAFPEIESARPEIGGPGFCLGATSSKKQQRVVVHSHTRDFEAATREILALLRQLGVVDGSFPFSSIQINHNAEVKPHTDRNGGLSIALSFGNFSGGELVVGGKVVGTFKKGVIVDGAVEHYVTAHSGDRYSMILFPYDRIDQLSRDDVKFLKDVGFVLDCETPVFPPRPTGARGSQDIPAVVQGAVVDSSRLATTVNGKPTQAVGSHQGKK